MRERRRRRACGGNCKGVRERRRRRVCGGEGGGGGCEGKEEEACGGEGKQKGGKKNRKMGTYKIWREKMGNSLTQVHTSS